MGYGGGYLYSGLAGIAGERYAADSLRAPEKAGLTQTARGGTTRALYGPTPQLSKVYGKIPFEEIEGHQVDPFYDVRGTGLGQMPSVARRELAIPQASPPRPDEEPLALPAAPDFPPELLYGALAFVAWRMLRRAMR